MSRKRLAFIWVPLVVTGAALTIPAAPAQADAPKQTETADKTTKLNHAFSVLHAVTEAATNWSKLAETKAKSPLVKSYASDMLKQNANAEEKLMAMAKREGIKVEPLDPNTEAGKSVIDRIKAETTLLNSLEGDAFDKSYMVLVTNHQQSIIRVLNAHKAMAKDKEVKGYLGELITTVEKRLKRAQDVMEKVYGDKV